MKTFFSILLSVCFLSSFCQSDSIKNRFTVGISPLLLVYPYEDGFYLEYQPKKKISFELGGGIYNLIKHPLNNYGISGFTVRSAIKFYPHRSANFIPYYEILCFYRQVQYENEFYSNDRFLEAGITIGAEPKNYKTGDDLKQVFCIESLFGVKHFLDNTKHWVIEFFFGCGVRMTIRDFNITKEKSGHTLTYYNPPKEETIISYLPSLHFGIKFGYSF